MEIDYKCEDPISELNEDSEAEKILNEMNDRGLLVKTEWENNQIFIVIEYNPDLSKHMDIEEKQDRLNELFETVHFGYDECPLCKDASPVKYSPEEFNFYKSTIQMCGCGGRMGREFVTQDEFDEIF